MDLCFKCTRCRREISVNTRQWRCDCGGPFDLEFAYRFPSVREVMERPSNIWRYREALPIEDDQAVVSFGEGSTPLVEDRVDGFNVYWKLEYVSPTGSVKDRGTSVLMSRMKEIGISEIVGDSSGNAGASIAAYCARGGIKARIFVPRRTSTNKKNQILTYGADLREVDGDREQTAEAAHREAEKVQYANQIWNPYFVHGTKTCAFEIVEQLGWQEPDWVLVPLGVGTIVLSLGLGFRELKEQGMIKRVPRIVGMQASNCCPFYDVWKTGEKSSAYQSTIAEGIAHSDSPRFDEIMEVIRESEGSVVAVTEEEIQEGKSALSKRGFYVEPTSAVALPAVQKLARKNDLSNQQVIVLLTGTGLKAAAA